MRDLVILALLALFSVWSLRRAWIGVMMWTCVSLMSPHIAFGYAAADWPVGTVAAICTLASMCMAKEKQNPFVGAPIWWLVAFNVWISITLPFSIFVAESTPLWQRSLKIFFMFYISLSLITDRRRLDTFIWIVVVSLAYYGLKGGVFTILSGGNYRVWGPGGFIEGNNEVALAVVAIIPLMRYLQMQMTSSRAKKVMTAAMALCVVMVLGSYSRGALLGVGAMGAFFWLKNDGKVQWGLLILLLGLAGAAVMPDAWFDRMDTIKTYEGDSSAQGRINAWWMAWNLARDRLFGGGFMIWNGTVFQMYAPVPDDPHAAHSIYFQVLGEHGFIGLFLFLGIGVSTWLAARNLIRAGSSDPEHKWAADLGAMVQVSMIGYGVTGAFLSLAYFDLPYDVMAMAVLGQRILAAQIASATAAKQKTVNDMTVSSSLAMAGR